MHCCTLYAPALMRRDGVACLCFSLSGLYFNKEKQGAAPGHKINLTDRTFVSPGQYSEPFEPQP